jgi:hypothetical protein
VLPLALYLLIHSDYYLRQRRLFLLTIRAPHKTWRFATLGPQPRSTSRQGPGVASQEVAQVLAEICGLSPPFDGDSVDIELVNVPHRSRMDSTGKALDGTYAPTIRGSRSAGRGAPNASPSPDVPPAMVKKTVLLEAANEAANVAHFDALGHDFDKRHPDAAEFADQLSRALRHVLVLDEDATSILDYACGPGQTTTFCSTPALLL